MYITIKKYIHTLYTICINILFVLQLYLHTRTWNQRMLILLLGRVFAWGTEIHPAIFASLQVVATCTFCDFCVFCVLRTLEQSARGLCYNSKDRDATNKAVKLLSWGEFASDFTLAPEHKHRPGLCVSVASFVGPQLFGAKRMGFFRARTERSGWLASRFFQVTATCGICWIL